MALLAVVPVGLALGAYLNGTAVTHGEHEWFYSLLLDILTSGLAPITMTWTATLLVRTTPERTLFPPAVLLVLPVMATHYARAYHPLLIFAAELSWLGVLFCFAKAKRTASLVSIVICGACVTAIQLSSAFVDFAARSHPRSTQSVCDAQGTIGQQSVLQPIGGP